MCSSEVRCRHDLELISEGNTVARIEMSALPPKADIDRLRLRHKIRASMNSFRRKRYDTALSCHSSKRAQDQTQGVLLVSKLFSFNHPTSSRNISSRELILKPRSRTALEQSTSILLEITNAISGVRNV